MSPSLAALETSFIDLTPCLLLQKIDVLLDYPSRKMRPPIFFIAKQNGILL